MELSSLVYEDVHEYELKKASRIHLFASDAYRRIVKSGTPNPILDSIDSINKDDSQEQFFVIRGRYALILGVCLPKVVILAVRGTVFRRLWDWKANVDAVKYYVHGNKCFHLMGFPMDFGLIGFGDLYFHRGFFESIVPQFPSIADNIKKHIINNNSSPTVVWTGHSLGGAMAAIGNALYSSDITRRIFEEPLFGTAVDSYTFGMPRYCSLGAIFSFATPHHIYKKEDIVPTVPLRKMGFVDCCREYEITDAGKVTLSERTDMFGVVGHIPKLLSSIKAHSIEGYAGSIAKALGVSRP